MNGRKFALTLLLVCTVVSCFLFIGKRTAGVEGGSGVCSVTVDAAREVARYNPLILGSNLNWINDGDGIYDPAAGKVREDAVRLIKDLGITMLRFPGGDLSEYYDWKQGVGPRQGRGMGLDYEKKPQKMVFGLDEFLRFCEEMHIAPLFTVGYANNTPRTAAQIVEYCNGPATSPLGLVRAGNGHPSPYGVKYWEIGNEVYNRGMTRGNAAEYGKKASGMAKAMKEADPSILVGAIGTGYVKQWDDAVLNECAGDLDFLVYHRYLPKANSSDETETNDAVVASTEMMAREVKLLQDTAKGYKPGLAVAVTEYNLDFRDGAGNFINKPSDTQQALFIAECIRRFQLGGVSFATKWHLAHPSRHYFSDINFNRGAKITLSPSYYAQQVYAGSGMATIVETRTVSPSVSVPSFGRVKDVRDAPLLTAIAGKDKSGRALSVIIINRDLHNQYSVRLDVTNFVGIRNIEFTSLKTPESGPADHFVSEKRALDPDALKGLRVPAGSISLLRLSA